MKRVGREIKSASTFSVPAMCLAFKPRFCVRNSSAKTPINRWPCGDFDVALFAQASAAVLSVRHSITICRGVPCGNILASLSCDKVARRTAVAAYCRMTTMNSKLLI